ncbi:hypothetical protein NBRC10512_000596 [Rhodotorula toruloides]|uniref:RHTO0S01e06260g1_1 n=2 Tax=Rhodotorula toruloides TaxID=5286 RepID=A0A061ALZ2_RHOTO|nr:protein required for cell viability [Rhodotorula toruloides NP11]EMS21763.1 protein required for cell viability [Rhodotorula toruloides NP11]CDR35749.1 RHTO0S01e06260g1_1 [Rhodotorula toruloides]
MSSASLAGQLKPLLALAGILLGLSQPSKPPPVGAKKPSLEDVLRNRLEAFYAAGGQGQSSAPIRAEQETAAAALWLLEQIALASRSSSSLSPSDASAPSTSAPPPPPTAPIFGARDIKAIGMLAGIVGRWGIGRVSPFGAGGGNARSGPPALGPKIQELEEDAEDDVGDARTKEEELAGHAKRVLSVLSLNEERLPQCSEGEKQFFAIVAPQLLSALLGSLVHFTQNLSADENWAREALDRLLHRHSPSATISHLLTLLGSAPSSLRQSLTTQLSTQLLRPGGVRSLLLVVIGTGASSGGEDEVGVRKLEMVRRVIETRPTDASLDAKAYYANITAQLLDILRAAASSSLAASLSTSSINKGKAPAASSSAPTPSIVPVPIIRAASYVVAHLLVRPAGQGGGDEAKSLVLQALHGPLLPISHPGGPLDAKKEEGVLLDSQDLATHLSLLSLLALYAPPLPSLLSTLLAPLLASLFSLLTHLSRPPLVALSSPTSDALKGVISDEASALLRTFAKGEEVPEAVKAVTAAVERWEKRDEFGVLPRGAMLVEEDVADQQRVEWGWSSEGAPVLRYAAGFDEAEDDIPVMGGVDEDGEEPDLSALSLQVDAVWLVGWLKDVDRKELSAQLFLRWLDEIKVLRGVQDVEDARRSVTRLQLVLQMVEQLGSDILSEPGEIIAFVAHALDAEVGETDASKPAASNAGQEPTLDAPAGLAGLRLVEEQEGEAKPKIRETDDAADADAGLGTGLGKDEMAMTALTLLLAVLEANETLDTSNTPLLAVIYSQLDTLASSTSSQLIPPLAREAKMVLSLRRASSAFDSAHPESTPAESDDPLAASRAKYREALKLLQDPLLPVRAQGLHLLRTLVLDRNTALLSTDPALLPAVLDIFVQAIEEEDSFLYLNAVQGLSSLVDVFGRQVIGRLLEVYTGARKGDREPKAVGEGEKGTRELDKRLRVGETLVQVVQRAGEALGMFVDDVVAPLLLVLRTATLPIPLRASAITILATCVETAPVALLQYADVLAEACTTLLSLETVPLAPRTRPPAPAPSKVDHLAGKGKKKASPAVLIEEVDSSDEESDMDEPEPAPLGKDGQPRRPEELPDPTTTASKHPALRRSAAVFLGSLVRTAAHQSTERREREERQAWDRIEDETQPFGREGLRMPFGGSISSTGGFLVRERRAGGEAVGSLIGAEQLVRARTVLRYVSETDEDALVREQTRQVLQELEDA